MELETDSQGSFKQRLQEFVLLEGERLFQEFPQQALTWLAVAPSWPIRLAERGFPVGDGVIGTGESVSSMLARAANERFSESREASGVRGGTTYWMNQSQRAFVIDKVLERNDRGLEYVRDEMRKAGIAISQAARDGISLSLPLLRWSELASRINDDEQLVRLFAMMVDTSLSQARKSNQTAAPEALRWIEAAEPFAKMFKGQLEVAVTRAGQKLELFHRRAYDARFLENYFVRPAQDQAFNELINGPDNLWALHFVGLGGTGKTMLMRHISSELAPSPDHNLAVARIDFDRINPDYPSIRPGLLLTGLAEELRVYADEFTPSSFIDFDRAIITLHEKFKSEASFGTLSGVSLEDNVFRGVLDQFVIELNSLWEHGKRPLLILDTCEELAKIRADGTQSDSVRVTFQILEFIHEKAPETRVIFSGRRPLAWSGDKWEFSTKVVKQSKDVNLEDHREYLRLYEIRGFTKGEAFDFLKSFTKSDQMVDQTLFDAILIQSNASDETFDSRFEFPGDPNAIDLAPRYNPYDLDMYASWSCDDKTLDAKKLGKGAHYYVRERIVDRAHHLLKKHLPEIVLLGRFDKEIVRELIVSAGDDFDILFPELIDQEWIDVDRVVDTGATVWAMDNVMRKRLLNYYEDAERSALNSAMTRVAEFLYDVTLNREWKNLTAAYFESALRTLSSVKVKAAEWWQKVEDKLAATGEWQWAMTLTDLLLAEGGPVARADVTAGMRPEQESVLRPAVLATRAAALTHLKPFESKNVWLEVLEKADRHPTTDGAQRLKFRAVAAIIASLRIPESAESALTVIEQCLNTVEKMPSDLVLSDAQSSASIHAAFEGLVELGERVKADGGTLANAELWIQASKLYKLFETHTKSPENLPRDLAIFINSLEARLRLATGNEQKVDDAFERALDAVGGSEFETTAQHWLDWHRPEDFRSHIRIQYIKAMYPAHMDVESVLMRVGDVPDNPTTLDTDRLASAVLGLKNWIGVPETDERFDQVVERLLSLHPGLPSSNAHRVVPPYFATLLKTKAASGFIDEVVRAGLNISKEAEAKSDTSTQQGIDRVLSRLAYRARLRDERSLSIGGSLATSMLIEDIDVRFILAALDGGKSTDRLDGWLGDESVNLRNRRHTLLAHIGWRTGRPLIEPDTRAFPSAGGEITYQKLIRSLDWPESVDPYASDEEQRTIVATRVFGELSFEVFSLFLDGVESQHESISTRKKMKLGILLNAWAGWQATHPKEPVEAVALYVRAASLTWGGVSRGPEIESRRSALDQLAKRIGKRRAAGIALEEGTLLALRLPQYARVAFELSRQWFNESGDVVGSLLANMSLSMLHAKLQDGDALRAQIELTRANYIQCAASVPVLPAWDGFFEGLAGESTVSPAQLIEFLDGLEGTCWRPWLVRLTTCLIRYREFGTPGELVVTLREWVEKNFSAVVNEAIRIPAEFDSSFLYTDSSSLEDFKSRRPWYISLKDFFSRQQKWFFGLLGLAFIGTVFVVFSRVVDRAYELFFGEIGTGWSMLLTGLIIFALSWLPKVFRWQVAIGYRLIEEIFTIENDDQVTDLNHPLESPAKVGQRTRVFGLEGPEQGTISLVPTMDKQYRLLSNIIPEDTRQNLARRSRWLYYYFANVTLSVNEENAGAAWEAVFGLVQQKLVGLEQNRFLIRRTVTTRTSSSFGTIVQPANILSWAPDISQIDMARAGWRNVESNVSSFVHSAERPTQQIEEQKKEVHVIHLVGSPVEAYSGIRLEIGEKELTWSGEYARTSSSSSQVDPPGGSVPAYERGFLVRAEELPLRFSDLSVCIVQGAILSEQTPRTNSQRFEAAKQRRFGADLAKCGIACVILLPPTTRDLSIELVAQIASLITKPKSSRRHWMKTVRTIQEIIADHGHLDKEAALEMALDVCIYMVDDFQFRTRSG